MEFFATCSSGLESILGDELRELGMDEVRPLTGGVAFSASMKGVYRALLWSRVASRILYVVGRIDAKDSDSLYESACSLDWEDEVATGKTIAVSARGTNEELRDSRYTALRVKDAICDKMRDVFGSRPDVDAAHPDVRIQVNLHRTKATVYIDLSGTTLEDRGYKGADEKNRSQIHETLAAAMLMAGGWQKCASQGGALVCDMCEDGTLAVEAAFMAGDIACKVMRSSWGVFGWKRFDEGLWNAELDSADAAAEDTSRRKCVTAVCKDGKALVRTKEQVAAAGVSSIVDVVESVPAARALDGMKAERCMYTGCFLAGEDFPAACEASVLAETSSTLLGRARIERAVLLVSNEDADAYMGISRSKSFDCMSGPHEAQIAVYDLYAQRGPAIFVTVRDAKVAVHDAGAQQFADRLNKMAKTRRKWAKKEDVSAYRVYDADLPDYNMAIDLYAGAGPSTGEQMLNIAEYAPPASIDAGKAARRMADAVNIARVVFDLSCEQVFVKRRRRARGGSQYGKTIATGSKSSGCVTNVSKPDKNDPGGIVTEENGLLFEVDLASYLDTGLFLDNRDVRALIGRLAHGKSFLNLFAYTCTASVYAAAGGAKFTTSVDLSNTYLERGKKNMELNGLLDSHQEFVRADCIEWVKQTRHSKFRWDLIFIDPPTFSNSSKMGKRSWDVQRDHAELLIGVSRLLTRGGAAVFSCNLRGFKLDEEPLHKAGIQVVDITDKTIPLDFERNKNIHRCFILRRI